MRQLVCLLSLAFCCLAVTANGESKIINCFFGIWPYYEYVEGNFKPENIDANLCTHLSFTFFGITDSGEFRVTETWLEHHLVYLNATKALKEINPKLKFIVSVGGLEEGSIKYSNLAADPTKRETFIKTSTEYIKQHGFDGLELGWEYPGQRGGLPQDKDNFVILLKEMKEAFSPFNLELNIGVGPTREAAAISYDIPNIAKYTDFITVLVYDVIDWADKGKLGFNSALKGQMQDNVEDCIKFWLESGAPASKLLLGLGSYGRSFELTDLKQTSPGSAISGPGAAGPLTREKGYLGYNEICKLLPDWTYVFDDSHGVCYSFKDNQWVDFDNVQSFNLKLDFLKSMKLAGVMLSSIETDDFSGECGEKYPLLNAINKKLK